MEEKRKITAKHLSRLYGDEMPIACACAGFECMHTGCAAWWEMFLERYAKQDIQAMVKAFEIIKQRAH